MSDTTLWRLVRRFSTDCRHPSRVQSCPWKTAFVPRNNLSNPSGVVVPAQSTSARQRGAISSRMSPSRRGISQRPEKCLSPNAANKNCGPNRPLNKLLRCLQLKSTGLFLNGTENTIRVRTSARTTDSSASTHRLPTFPDGATQERLGQWDTALCRIKSAGGQVKTDRGAGRGALK